MNKNIPAVSVIIPVYNVERYLRRCLDSVLAQTFQNWEAICVNDGSPDNSAAILAEYSARDGRFKVVDKENGGLSDARNAGMGVATGEYVLFLDSDDFIHPQTIEITLGLARGKNADMVLFGYDEKFHKQTRELMQSGADISGRLPDAKDIVYDTARIKSFTTDRVLNHCTERNHGFMCFGAVRRHCFTVLGLYRREMIADLPFVRGIIMEDFPWWSAVILRARRTVMINTPLYFYMPNPASILNSSAVMRMVESIAVGLQYAYDIYSGQATSRQRNHYNREFLWPFAITMMRKIFSGLETDDQKEKARQIVAQLWDSGVFDNPRGMRAKKYRRRIQKFIGK